MTQEYIGTKQVTAWVQSKDGAEGYAVKYPDGYISWSPKGVFEGAYLPLGHITHMPAHQQRVIGEFAQLTDKLGKLSGFVGTDLFLGLSEAEQDRLLRQAAAMRDYAAVLAERVASFGGA